MSEDINTNVQKHQALRDKLYAAIAKAQLKIFNPGKNRSVSMVTKEGKPGPSYEYAELNVITEIIRIPLSENGLSYTQEIGVRPFGKENLDGIITNLQHESGQEKEFFYPLVGASYDVVFKSEQNYAKIVTYSKRQALKGIFGMADDTEDKDNADSNSTIVNKKTGEVIQKPESSQNSAKPQPKPTPQTQGAAKATPKPPQQAPKASPPPAAQKPPEPEDIPQQAPADEFQDQSKPDNKKGPGDYVIAYGSTKYDGKKISQIGELELREMNTWIQVQLKRVPPPKNLSLLFDTATSIRLFFESMDLKL